MQYWQLENHELQKSSLSLSNGELKWIVYFIVYSAKYCDRNIRQNATIINLQSDVISIEYIKHSWIVANQIQSCNLLALFITKHFSDQFLEICFISVKLVIYFPKILCK